MNTSHSYLYFHILAIGDDIPLNVVGFGIVQVDNGDFNDVLCVPSLSYNLLSIYQITHSGKGKIVKFSPH
jgi:hypothetical protein